MDIVKTTLGECPPELAGDIMDRGIALTGVVLCCEASMSGCARRQGCRSTWAENPLELVVLGTGKCVEDFGALRQVLVPQRRR